MKPIPARPFPALATLGAAMACALPAHAARPLNTDDARIVDHGACQLESWVRNGHESRETWALPGCNPTGNLEITVGGGRVRDGEGSRTLALVVQGKTLIKPLEPNGWGWGVALGVSRDPTTGSNDPYVYLPFTWSLREDKTFVHLNLGAKREGLEHRKLTTWGLGLEQPLSAHWGLIGETYQQDKGKPLFQLGGRVWIVPDRVQIDGTVGNRFGGGERWFSIGLRLLTPAFMH
jgi:hypothetical protein